LGSFLPVHRCTEQGPVAARVKAAVKQILQAGRRLGQSGAAKCDGECEAELNVSTRAEAIATAVSLAIVVP